ncbi:MAG: hypothetical protein EAZ85_14805 [Bacteroidetes bacterium]|nr:MAG: hypothetical protein EAZ85_14805 [Bacteroidota bacterium]TAG85503.1 MAG: hypothetical protein EAZ20_14930 [Bacteroidota bacterium]
MQILQKNQSQNQLSAFLAKQKTEENNLQIENRQQNGIFFTHNHNTIDEILAIIDFSTIENKKILEPACGYGIFIIRILEKVYEQNNNKDFIINFISNNIIFNDIAIEMIEKTKENIKKIFFNWFQEEYKDVFQGFVSDFTLKNTSQNEDLFAIKNTIILEKFYNQIDYIVGNPPYISLYGRRDKKQNEQQRIDYLKNYAQFPNTVKNGKINLVMLFLEHSLCFLKENAKVSFIIDISFFETAYQYTRKFLLEKAHIQKLITNIQDFEVTSGQIIIQYAKNNLDSEKNTLILDKSTQKSHTINQKIWQNPNDEYKFRLNFDEETKKIIHQIKSKNDKTILQTYPNKNLRTCAMLLDMEDKFTKKNKNDFSENILIFPYYQGSKALSKKYDTLKFEKFFGYDKNLQDNINDELKTELALKGIKNKKRIGLGEAIIYENPKIFIRQSAKEIIASIDYDKSSANNSLYIFSLRDNSENSIFTLKYICAWLNSNLMTFFAQKQNIIRFAKGKQPQIKIADLGTIPLPNDKKLQEKLVFFCSQIIDLQIDKEVYKQKINELVYQYYNIEENDIIFIEKSIKEF